MLCLPFPEKTGFCVGLLAHLLLQTNNNNNNNDNNNDNKNNNLILIRIKKIVDKNISNP